MIFMITMIFLNCSQSKNHENHSNNGKKNAHFEIVNRFLGQVHRVLRPLLWSDPLTAIVYREVNNIVRAKFCIVQPQFFGRECHMMLSGCSPGRTGYKE